jgi:hypothetical protein
MGWEDADIEKDEGMEGEFWEPLPDETLQGTVLKIKSGKFGKLFMVIEDDDGEVWFTPQHANLDRQIKNLQKKSNLTEDDTVHVKYLGLGEQPEDPSYNPPQLYKLRVWRE